MAMAMQRFARIVVGLVLVLAVGCSSSDDDGDDASGSTGSTGTTVVEMSIPDITEAPPSAPGDGPSGQVIMLKLHVDDIDDGAAFYTTVFGATQAVELGEGVRVMTMEDGPGFILIEDDADESEAWNAQFLIQVPDLEEAEAVAVDNGATHQQSFEGSPGGQQAQSVDLLDPWGNQIEILQLS